MENTLHNAMLGDPDAALRMAALYQSGYLPDPDGQNYTRWRCRADLLAAQKERRGRNG